MNDGQGGPAWFTMAQPIEKAFAGVRARSVRVPAGGLVHHQQMLILENQARQHAPMEPRTDADRQESFAYPRYPRNPRSSDHARFPPSVGIGFLIAPQPDSPELPRTFQNDPDAQQEIRDSVGGHGIAQAILAQHQPLETEAAKDAAQPLIM